MCSKWISVSLLFRMLFWYLCLMENNVSSAGANLIYMYIHILLKANPWVSTENWQSLGRSQRVDVTIVVVDLEFIMSMFIELSFENGFRIFMWLVRTKDVACLNSRDTNELIWLLYINNIQTVHVVCLFECSINDYTSQISNYCTVLWRRIYGVSKNGEITLGMKPLLWWLCSPWSQKFG